MFNKLTLFYRFWSDSTLSVLAPGAGVPLLDDLHLVTVRVLGAFLLSLASLLFPMRKEEWVQESRTVK